MCFGLFSPGRIKNLILKKSVTATMIAAVMMMTKSQLLSGPVPCVMFCKALGCCDLHISQAETLDIINKMKNILNLIFELIVLRCLNHNGISNFFDIFYGNLRSIISPTAPFVVNDGSNFFVTQFIGKRRHCRIFSARVITF